MFQMDTSTFSFLFHSFRLCNAFIALQMTTFPFTIPRKSNKCMHTILNSIKRTSVKRNCFAFLFISLSPSLPLFFPLSLFISSFRSVPYFPQPFNSMWPKMVFVKVCECHKLKKNIKSVLKKNKSNVFTYYESGTVCDREKKKSKRKENWCERDLSFVAFFDSFSGCSIQHHILNWK